MIAPHGFMPCGAICFDLFSLRGQSSKKREKGIFNADGLREMKG